MANFTNYLKFTNKFDCMDRQIKNISTINLSEENIESLLNIDKEIKLLVFAHPECMISSKIVGVLEKLAFHIPLINIDYISKYDENSLLSYTKETNLLSVLKIESIKVTLIFSENKNFLSEILNLDIENEKEFIENLYKGLYDEKIIEYLINRIGE